MRFESYALMTFSRLKKQSVSDCVLLPFSVVSDVFGYLLCRLEQVEHLHLMSGPDESNEGLCSAKRRGRCATLTPFAHAPSTHFVRVTAARGSEPPERHRTLPTVRPYDKRELTSIYGLR